MLCTCDSMMYHCENSGALDNIMQTIHDKWLRLAADLVLIQKNVCIEIKGLYNVAANPTPPP